MGGQPDGDHFADLRIASLARSISRRSASALVFSLTETCVWDFGMRTTKSPDVGSRSELVE
jgi:hypothetical protein